MKPNSADGFVPLVALTQANSEEDPEYGVEISDASRRRFISLMAGSLALAGLTGCTRQPTETIMPYVDAPEDLIPGKPKYYATAVPGPGYAQGVIVESHEGRPTKVEGNPDHPASLGATGVHAQACLMDLYDPDRATNITYLGVQRTWEDFLLELNRIGRNGRLRILTETVISPVLANQIREVLAHYPNAKWHQYEPAGNHSARAASQAVFGKPVNTILDFTKANAVLSLDCDFLMSTRHARDFANRRRRGNRVDMNRLYVVESTMTPTGGKADHRLAVKYADVEAIAREFLAFLNGGAHTDGGTRHGAWVDVAAKDLISQRGACLVIAGEHQSPAVHALAHQMNATLGNVGSSVSYTDSVEAESIDQIQSLRELTGEMYAGAVDFLLMLGGNPIYNAPVDLAFAGGLKKVKTCAHVSLHANETSSKATWHVPEPHFLEDWGDTRGFDGTASIIQPLIAPLYDSHSFLSVLDALVQYPGRTSYEIVRAYWTKISGAADFETWWRKSVHDGLVAGSAFPVIKVNATGAVPEQASADTGMELVFRPDIYMYDGRYANNIWLQELPHPMTKLTWDNAVFLSPATAKRLQIENQQHVALRVGSQEVYGSVWVLPGHPDESIGVDLGYGRTQAGRAGNGAGFNAYLLRQSQSMWRTSGAQLRKLDSSYPLATTQMQQTMAGRDVVIWNTQEGYKKDPEFAQQTSHPPADNLTLYPHWQYKGYKWGMSIDLTACVNCQACVVACQAENNIPVVGKEQVLARRAMHWLRIDTYYEEGFHMPTAHYMPVPCMQCENAPCELVCPVQATNHSSEGLNDMVYNRCVGTRYCSNNCPYKVRRFNFLLFQDWTTETLKLQRNPDVTVRSRGVMEKCTYCVQRIKEAEITAEKENRFVRDGEIQTACQQVCPTNAIVFGDVNNSGNQVAKLKAEKLDYSLLAELNTRPRTTYLAELRNPNPELKEGSGE